MKSESKINELKDALKVIIDAGGNDMDTNHQMTGAYAALKWAMDEGTAQWNKNMEKLVEKVQKFKEAQAQQKN